MSSMKLPKGFGSERMRVVDLEDTDQTTFVSTEPPTGAGRQGDEVIVPSEKSNRLFKYLNGTWTELQEVVDNGGGENGN